MARGKKTGGRNWGPDNPAPKTHRPKGAKNKVNRSKLAEAAEERRAQDAQLVLKHRGRAVSTLQTIIDDPAQRSKYSAQEFEAIVLVARAALGDNTSQRRIDDLLENWKGISIRRHSTELYDRWTSWLASGIGYDEIFRRAMREMGQYVLEESQQADYESMLKRFFETEDMAQRLESRRNKTYTPTDMSALASSIYQAVAAKFPESPLAVAEAFHEGLSIGALKIGAEVRLEKVTPDFETRQIDEEKL